MLPFTTSQNSHPQGTNTHLLLRWDGYSGTLRRWLSAVLTGAHVVFNKRCTSFLVQVKFILKCVYITPGWYKYYLNSHPLSRHIAWPQPSIEPLGWMVLRKKPSTMRHIYRYSTKLQHVSSARFEISICSFPELKKKLIKWTVWIQQMVKMGLPEFL